MKTGAKYFLDAKVALEAGRLEEAQWLLECTLAYGPRVAFAWLHYADVLRRQKKYRNAVAATGRAIQSTLERAKPNQNIIDGAYRIEGLCFFKLKQFDECEIAFRHAIEIEAAPESWDMLGRALYYQDRDEEATECFRQSIALDPDNEEGHYLLAFMIADAQPDEAEKHLRRAIELDPEYAWAWTDLATLLMRNLHRADETRQAIDKAIGLMPNYAWTRLHYANWTWQFKEIELAKAQFEAALTLAPNECLMNLFYGDFLSAEQIDPERAEVLLRRALELDPDDEDSYFFLGRHLWRYERDDEARPFLEKAAALGNERATKLLDKMEVETD